MLGRFTFVALAVLGHVVCGQTSVDSPEPTAPAGKWRAAGNGVGKDSGDARRSSVSLATHAQFASSSDALSDMHGQAWRQYDIRGFTDRFPNVTDPQRWIVDWILRETGTEKWFTEPMGCLSANRNLLKVYHTQDVQRVAAQIVDRFIDQEATDSVFHVRMLTLGSPNWRAKAQGMLHPIHSQSSGAEAWVLSREEAALITSSLEKRTDFVEINTAHTMVRNGQEYVMSRTRPIAYPRSIVSRANTWPGYELATGRIEEGFSLEFSPLMSVDSKSIDAVIKWSVQQVEKFEPISINVASANNPRQDVQIQVPHQSGWRIHERFRWPSDRVLLVSLGVVVSPTPGRKPGSFFGGAFSTGPPRRDVLFLVEFKGSAGTALASEPPSAVRSASLNTRGRY